MPHEFAKSLLRKARTPLTREKAVRVALRLGMPLHEIEEFLDWLDMIRARRNGNHSRRSRNRRDTKK